MVIFHSYVKLPEGNTTQKFGAGLWFIIGEFMTFISQKLGNKLKFVPPRCYSELMSLGRFIYSIGFST